MQEKQRTARALSAGVTQIIPSCLHNSTYRSSQFGSVAFKFFVLLASDSFFAYTSRLAAMFRNWATIVCYGNDRNNYVCLLDGGTYKQIV